MGVYYYICSMTVFITGASKGLGFAMAKKFAAEGYNLILTSRSDIDLYKAVEDLYLHYPAIKIKAQAADISTKEGCTQLCSWVSQQWPVDVLINNAGSFIPGSVHAEAEGTLENMLNINLYSAYHITRNLLPQMVERNSGHIFNICSIASIQAYSNGGSYSISKFAMYGFSKNLREEMKPHNIKVTAVLPGATYTNSWAGSGINPVRIMEANDVAEMVLAASKLSPQACVEEIVMRPQAGDL
jgi:short-subunit dehydrogenase